MWYQPSRSAAAVCVGLVPVARHHVRPAHQISPDLARPALVAVGATIFEATPGVGAAARAEPRRADHVCSSAQAVTIDDVSVAPYHCVSSASGKVVVRRRDPPRSRPASRRARARAGARRRAGGRAARPPSPRASSGRRGSTVIASRSSRSRQRSGSNAGSITARPRPARSSAHERRDAGDVEHRGRREEDVVARQRARQRPCGTRWR